MMASRMSRLPPWRVARGRMESPLHNPSTLLGCASCCELVRGIMITWVTHFLFACEYRVQKGGGRYPREWVTGAFNQFKTSSSGCYLLVRG